MIKRAVFSFLSVLALNATYAQARMTTCNEVQFGNIETLPDNNKVYRFPVTQECTIAINNTNFLGLLNWQLSDYKTKADRVHSETGTNEHKVLLASRTFSSEDGSLKTKDQIVLKTDSKTYLNGWVLSKEIEAATGNMEYSKRVFVVTEIKLNPENANKLHVKLQHIVDIEKPMLAPRSIFISEAKRGLTESTDNLTKRELLAALEVLNKQVLR